MSKRRAIISYDKLTIDQKKQILKDFPDGYINHLTTIKTPTGETLDALMWETEEVIYLVKINKVAPKAAAVDEDDERSDSGASDLRAELIRRKHANPTTKKDNTMRRRVKTSA